MLSAGAQSAMAKNIVANGTLMVWNSTGTLSRGSITIERCIGPVKGMNRDGIAVWVKGPNGEHPILLQADAGYCDMPTLSGGQKITALTVSHHGGKTWGQPPGPTATHPRVPFSFGHKNTHKHPRQSSFTDLTTAGWTVGNHPGAAVNDLRTEDRRNPPSTAIKHDSQASAGLGHIKLDWASGTSPAHGCTCGCTLDPTQ